MRSVLFICAAVLAVGANPGATQEKKKTDTDKPMITVTGCVDGSWLHVRKSDAVGSYAERYKLRGSKGLLKEIASKHDGHVVEVTRAVTDTANTVHRGKTVQVGKKTRIYTGAKDIPSTPSGDDPTLEVGSYRELKATCG